LQNKKGDDMKSRSLFRNLIVSSALVAIPLLVIAQQGQRKNVVHFPHYTVTDLGVLGAGTNATAFDTNDVGWVAGSSNLTAGGPQHAFVWYGHGPLKDLGTLGGAACPLCNSAADGPNLLGETAIGSEISTPDPDGEDFCAYGTHLQCRGVVSRNGKLIALRNLPGGRNANAFGINDLGQLVGFAENGIRDSTCATTTPFQVFRFEAVEWEPSGTIRELPPLTKKGDTVAFAMGINNLGQVVGSSGTCATQGLPPLYVTGHHAVLWDRNGNATYLGTLGDAANTASNSANSINNFGQVVGTSQFTDGTVHSFLWTKATGMQGLEPLPGAFATIAGCCRTINDRGDVAGFAFDNTGPHAVVWINKKISDLNALIPSGSLLYLLSADSINDSGEIVGQACVLPDCSVFHSFRATPE
jgi:probable HAF family extracellular repeat protein